MEGRNNTARTRSLTPQAVSGRGPEPYTTPPNLIPPGCQTITPQMLPLVQLDLEQIERLVSTVAGGTANIQDIYPLAPLQEGILFHHLLDNQGDIYVAPIVLEFQSRARLDAFTEAIQKVVDRHDILRTAVVWQQLPRPLQVVYRQARVPLIELGRTADPVALLEERLAHAWQRLDLQRAPLLRIQIAGCDADARWYVLLQIHHLVFDGRSSEILVAEVMAHMEGRAHALHDPQPYRDYVAQTLAQNDASDGRAFFREKLSEIVEPSAPLGIVEVRDHGWRSGRAVRAIDPALGLRIRTQARRHRVIAATLFHAAWALVVAGTSGRNDVVYGDVVLGQMKGVVRPGLGVFINSLPLRLKIGTLTAKELVAHTQREMFELFEHVHTSPALAHRCSGISGSAPLFTTLLNYRHSTLDPRTAWTNTTAGIRTIGHRSSTSYPITLSIDDFDDRFLLTAQTDPQIDAGRIADYLHTALQSLVEALEEAPQTPAVSLSILPEQERQLVVDHFNAMQVAYPAGKLVHHLVAEQTERTPDATAVEYAQQFLTYTELDSRAERVAKYLRVKGVGPDQTVGVCMERSPEMMIALLGVLKSGGAYLPLDPGYPPERLQLMLEGATPKVILTQQRLRPLSAQTRAEVIALDAGLPVFSDFPEENLSSEEPCTTDENLVYVIYTSGSTGVPKGTAMPHRSMVNLLQWHRDQFDANEGQRVLQFAALSFDVAFQETFTTLCTGGTLVLLDEWLRRDVGALSEFLSHRSIQRLFVPPLMLQSLAEHCALTGAVPGSLRDIVTAGEQLRISPQIVSLFERLDRCRLHNHYGPTETHVVTAFTLSGAPSQWPLLPSIGRPISNTRVYVLDERRQPVPLGVMGEIYIGGPAVARGYLNRSDLTDQRFIENPLDPSSPGRVYRTGDLGRWHADGTLEYAGRNDDQVKIRGYRIETGEIEARLAQHRQVREAAVIAREDFSGEKRLVAYITHVPDGVPRVEELRAYTKALLPEYMVPSAFVLLQTLPLTPTGKLDRRALPAPESEAYARRLYEAPKGDVEEILAGIWQSLLHVERIGRHDDFFELGGHSLLIVQVLDRLRRVGLSADIRRIFANATLADMADTLTKRVSVQLEVPTNLIPPECDAITPQMLPLVQLQAEHIQRIVAAVDGGATNIQDIYPLSPLQEGILFHHLLHEERRDVYARALLFSLPSEEGVQAFIGALQVVVDRHDALRTAVIWEHLPQPVQVVQRRATLPVKILELDQNRDPTEQLRERMQPERQQLDLRRAPLIRLEVAADPVNRRWLLLLQTHHFVCDNQSLDILLSEAMACFTGHAAELPEPAPYRNHIAQVLAHERTHDSQAFFRAKLGDVEEPTAVFGLLSVQGDGSKTTTDRRILSAELATNIRTQARRLGVSTATIFHAAFALVISHTSARDDVVFGSVLLGRMQGSAGAQRILGMFINTLPLRIRLLGVTARQLIEQAQRELVELLGYDQASLAVAQRCSRVSGSVPLFNALLNYLHDSSHRTERWSGGRGVTLLEGWGKTNYPLVLTVDDFGKGFRLEAETDAQIDPHRITDYLSSALQSLVKALEEEPQTLALSLSILPEHERQLLVERFNAPHVVYPQEKLIHELFEEQVQRTPGAVAIVYEGQSLTYAELNSRSNRLASYLIDKGVGPNQLVGICVERSLEMVVGLVGILKAGGAYVPLDPAYPSERLAYMLKDAAPRVLLIQERLRKRLPQMSGEVIALDTDWNEIEESIIAKAASGTRGPSCDRLAYVMYTSGSTGEPKGVMVEHRNVTRLFAATHRWFGFDGRDVWTLFHSFAFDFSVWELWGALLYGGRVVVVPYLTSRSSHEFYRLVCEQGVTVLNQTPSAFAQLIDAQARSVDQRHSLRVVIFGGEALELRTLRPWVERNGAERPQLVNMYGITETTVHVTYRPLSAQEIDSERGSLIGRPIADLQAHLLDGHGQLAPLGVVGEIYVGGSGVARGYLNRPRLTAERFVSNPFSTNPEARMYRTGDLGRWRADGTIEYLGRNDHQVKIRGFRIELGEIEAQLLRHAQVKEAVVVAREDVPGEKRLVAYLIVRNQDTVSVEEIRGYLKIGLPEHMVPSAFVLLECLPLTPNGKLDRRALPAPDLSAYPSREYEAPRGEVEEILAGIWQSLLHVERIGRHDDFFELGGHSLIGVKLIVKIAEHLHVPMPVVTIFQYPTISQMARFFEPLLARESRAPQSDELELQEGIL